MNNIVEIIISALILIIITILKVIINKRRSNNYKDELYKKAKKINIFLVFFSILLFVISFLVNHYIEKEINIFLNVLNSLAIAFIPFPLSIFNLYKTSITEEDKLIYITNVVTTIKNEKYTKLFNKAGIHLIVLSEEKPKFIRESIEESAYKKTYLNSNLHIKTTSKKILSRMKNDNIIYEFDNLEILYNRIIKARGTHDNYLRTLKYNFLTYIPLLILYTILKMNGFPFSYNLLLLMITKLFTTIISEFIYKYLPYDSDIQERKPNDKIIIFNFQEIVLLLIECFIINIILSIPYMNLLAQGGSIQLSNTIFYTSFIYTNIFITISLYSEQIFLKNILKLLKKIPTIIYIICSIFITISFNYIFIFNTKYIGLQNYAGSILMGFVSILFLEIIKLARLTKVKGVKKHGIKNNKKHRRS